VLPLNGERVARSFNVVASDRTSGDTSHTPKEVGVSGREGLLKPEYRDWYPTLVAGVWYRTDWLTETLAPGPVAFFRSLVWRLLDDLSIPRPWVRVHAHRLDSRHPARCGARPRLRERESATRGSRDRWARDASASAGGKLPECSE
jgi:hypothetical protein